MTKVHAIVLSHGEKSVNAKLKTDILFESNLFSWLGKLKLAKSREKRVQCIRQRQYLVILNGDQVQDFEGQLRDDLNHVELIQNQNPILSHEHSQQQSTDSGDCQIGIKRQHILAQSVVSLMTGYLDSDIDEKQRQEVRQFLQDSKTQPIFNDVFESVQSIQSDEIIKSAGEKPQSVHSDGVLAQINVDGSSDYVVKSNQKDYFYSNRSREIVKSNSSQPTVEAMQAYVIGPLNQGFKEPCIKLCPTPKYLRLKCHFTKCPFQIWYKFSGDMESPRDMVFDRAINQNHSISAHAKGEVQSLKFLQ